MSLNALIVFQGWTGARGNWLQNDTLGYLCMVVGQNGYVVSALHLPVIPVIISADK